MLAHILLMQADPGLHACCFHLTVSSLFDTETISTGVQSPEVWGPGCCSKGVSGARPQLQQQQHSSLQQS